MATLAIAAHVSHGELTCPVSHGEAAHVSHGMAGCVGTYGYSVSSPGTRGLWLEFLKQLISD